MIACLICGTEESIVFDASYGGGWYAFCEHCYDGAPDGGHSPMGHGRTKDGALSALRVQQEIELPAKPTALEINACAERLNRDCARVPLRHDREARFWITEVVRHAPTSPEHALCCALLAMRYNPRAFALAGLIGQHIA